MEKDGFYSEGAERRQRGGEANDRGGRGGRRCSRRRRQLGEESKLKEVEGGEDNSISDPFCVTDVCMSERERWGLDKRINYVNAPVLKRCTVITMTGSRESGTDLKVLV